MTSDEILRLIETPVPYYTWLTSLDPQTLVGMPRQSCYCPIAHYLVQHNVSNPMVGPATIVYGKWGDESMWIATPSWIVSFMDVVDMLPTEQELTARQVIAILRDLSIWERGEGE